MIRKDWKFCGHNLQAVAILDKKLKIFVFILYIFYLAVAFQQY